MNQTSDNRDEVEFPRLRRPAIVAVMGLPHTGSRYICKMIEKWAKCSVYSIEPVLDVLSQEQGYLNDPDDEEAVRLQHISFNVICQMAEHQVRGAYSGEKCVVICSTFFDDTRLNRLIALTRETRFVWARPLLIIECQRKNKFRWQQSYGDDETKSKWYEPKSWKDVEKAICKEEVSNESFVTLVTNNKLPHVKKLVIDPVEAIFYDNWQNFVGHVCIPPLLAKAIKQLLITSDVDEYQHDSSIVVEFDVWRRKHLENGGGRSRVNTRDYSCKPGDCIFKFTDNLQAEETCEICDETITEKAYYCQFCSLSFHEQCATEAVDTKMMQSELQESFNIRIREFHKMYACYSCIDQGKEPSNQCKFCLFRTFIKSQILPVIFNHNVDDHPLSLHLFLGLWPQPAPYSCNACGLRGLEISYCCNICKSRYHWECLQLPLDTEHEHGGHLHSMERKFSCIKEEEYEWCLACYKNIDPEIWVYTCKECDYVAHVHCVFPTIFNTIVECTR